jgi:hypothetical protein
MVKNVNIPVFRDEMSISERSGQQHQNQAKEQEVILILLKLLFQWPLAFQVGNDFLVQGTFLDHIVFVPELLVIGLVLVLQRITVHPLCDTQLIASLRENMVDKQLLMQFSLKFKFVGNGIVPVDLVVNRKVIEKEFSFKEFKINDPFDAFISPPETTLLSQVLRHGVLIFYVNDAIGFLVNEHFQVEFLLV